MTAIAVELEPMSQDYLKDLTDCEWSERPAGGLLRPSQTGVSRAPTETVAWAPCLYIP
jgi:hypothetical protein